MGSSTGRARNHCAHYGACVFPSHDYVFVSASYDYVADVESVAEFVAEPIAESVAEFVAESVADAEFVAESVAESVVEAVLEPVSYESIDSALIADFPRSVSFSRCILLEHNFFCLFYDHYLSVQYSQMRQLSPEFAEVEISFWCY